MWKISEAYEKLIQAYKEVDSAFESENEQEAIDLIQEIKSTHQIELESALSKLPFSLKNFLKIQNTQGLLELKSPWTQRWIPNTGNDLFCGQRIPVGNEELKNTYGRANLEKLKNDQHNWINEEEYQYIINIVLPQYHRLLKKLKPITSPRGGETKSSLLVEDLCYKIIQQITENEFFKEDLIEDIAFMSDLKKRTNDNWKAYHYQDINRLSKIIFGREERCIPYMTNCQQLKHTINGIVENIKQSLAH